MPPVNKCPCGEKTGEQVSANTNKEPTKPGSEEGRYLLHKDLLLISCEVFLCGSLCMLSLLSSNEPKSRF